jgi:hypothetical protein
MSLDGDWYNELRSHMHIECADGAITGYYESHVGSASGQYALTGSYDPDAQDDIALGFAVTWHNEVESTHATTAWCGEYQINTAGAETIVTTWLLVVSTEPGDDWESTKIGQDVFGRTPPREEQHLMRLASRSASHPGVQKTRV